MSFRCRVPAIIFVLLGGLTTMAGCTEGSDRATIEAVPSPGPSEACDDRIELADEPPDEAQSDGMTQGVGEGGIWFFAPVSGRWGDVVIHDGTDIRGKFPMWVGTDELPEVSVVRTTGDPLDGSVSMNPTSDGLPGPLPANVHFPSPGCWQVIAALGSESATITVHVV